MHREMHLVKITPMSLFMVIAGSMESAFGRLSLVMSSLQTNSAEWIIGATIYTYS